MHFISPAVRCGFRLAVASWRYARETGCCLWRVGTLGCYLATSAFSSARDPSMRSGQAGERAGSIAPIGMVSSGSCPGRPAPARRCDPAPPSGHRGRLVPLGGPAYRFLITHQQLVFLVCRAVYPPGASWKSMLALPEKRAPLSQPGSSIGSCPPSGRVPPRSWCVR
jgi:hypothetical protein